MAMPAGETETQIDVILDRLLAATGADAAELFVREPSGGRLWMAAHRGLAARDFQERTAFDRGEGYPGIVAEHGEPLLSLNVGEDPRFVRTRVARRGFRCALCVPVTREDGELLGALQLAARGHHRAVVGQDARAAAAAREIATLIELGDLRAKDAVSGLRADAELDAARNLERRLGGALELMAQATGAEGGIVLLRDEASGALHPWAWTGAYASACAAVAGAGAGDGGGCACSVIRDGRGLIAPSRPAETARACRIAPAVFARIACLPLVVDERLLGAVSLGYGTRTVLPGRLVAVLGAMTGRLAAEVADAQAAHTAERRAIAERDLRLRGELDDLVERSLRPALLHRGGGDGVLEDVEDVVRSSARALANVHGAEPDPTPVAAPLAGALDIRCFGALTVYRDAQRIDGSHVRRRRAWTLLEILLASYGHSVDDDVLLERLWPDGPPPGAASQLKVIVHDLRHALAPQPDPPRPGRFVVRRAGGYAFDTAAPHRIDTQEFLGLARWGERLAQLGDAGSALVAYRAATDLYGGDLLEDERYADWCANERDFLRERHLDVQRHTATLLLARGDREGAIGSLRRALRADDTLEDVHRELIRLLGEAGRVDDARRQYRACAGALRRALGCAPQPETRALAARFGAAG
jgi:DNA-binding SARP family transcriptional activator